MRWYRSIKLTIGFALAITIANFFKLDFPISAGIVAMLNMLDTKRASAKVAWRRLYAAAIGLLLDLIIFSLFGYHLWVMILLIGIFVPIAFKLNAREGMAIHIVLASHFMVYEVISLTHLWNEYLLVVIGAIVALTLNLHMPNKEPRLLLIQKSLENNMQGFILNLSYNIRNMCLLDSEDYNLADLEKQVKDGKKMALEYMENHYLRDENFYIEYFQMRLQQLRRLQYMDEHLRNIILNQNEAIMLSVFTEELAEVFELNNNGLKLLVTIKRLKEDLKRLDLPKSYFELEQKAFLLRYTSDLEEFIQLKVRFSETYL